MKIIRLIIALTLFTGSAAPSFADTASTLNTEAAHMNTLASSQGESRVVDKISGEFSSFFGSDAKAVVTGLRNGTPITLTTTTTTPGSTPGAQPVTTTTSTIINPPTGKMGFGNVFISLALAKQQLSQLGINQPTPQQLQAALTGGTITMNTGTTATGAATTSTSLQGILTMRSQNMGWGQIAQKLGFKLGPVVSSIKSANQSITVVSSSSKGSGSVNTGQRSANSSESGIVSSSGKSYGSSGHGTSAKSSSGEGIVSASSRSAGNGNAYGKGIVTGSGQVPGGNSAVSSAGGHGNSGQGKGQNK